MSRILYLGDTALDNAAAYLAGLMHHWGWPFDYVSSDRPADPALFEQQRPCFVLSDYAAAMLNDELQRRVIQQVERGAGLLMCGGWESFHGSGGDWNDTPLGEALPVAICGDDDRVNCDRPVLVRKTTDHPILMGLPWDERPPLIGGYNRVTPRDGAMLLLQAQQFAARCDDGRFTFDPQQSDPLLIVGGHGNGRTAALATDVAPHWVGPLVDWGTPRVTAQADGAEEIEVGGNYARFLRQLIGWVAKFEIA